MNLRLILVILVALASPSLATPPGTPMDCSDLILEPGLRCEMVTSPGEGGSFGRSDETIDNEGRLLLTGTGSLNDILEDLGPCGNFNVSRVRLVYTLEGANEVPVVSVKNRCVDAASSTMEWMRSSGVLFDSVAGALVVGLNSGCTSRGNGCDNFSGGNWRARIEGFPSLADLLGEGPTDEDNDGEEDGTDQCQDTPSGASVDSEGCSQEQHCEAKPVNTLIDHFRCWQADWLDDEEDHWPADCRVIADTGYRCVAD